MKRIAQTLRTIAVTLFALGAMSLVAQMQQGAPLNGPILDVARRGTSNNPDNLERVHPLDQPSDARKREERRSKSMNSERRRMMLKEATQMVQTSAQLQEALTHPPDKALLEEEARRAEEIEKLARSVKDRMKGNQ